MIFILNAIIFRHGEGIISGAIVERSLDIHRYSAANAPRAKGDGKPPSSDSGLDELFKSIVCLYLDHREQSLRSLCLARLTRNSAHRPGDHGLPRHGIIVPDLGFPFDRITVGTSLLQL